jgi:hypothetical protein
MHFMCRLSRLWVNVIEHVADGISRSLFRGNLDLERRQDDVSCSATCASLQRYALTMTKSHLVVPFLWHRIHQPLELRSKTDFNLVLQSISPQPKRGIVNPPVRSASWTLGGMEWYGMSMRMYPWWKSKCESVNPWQFAIIVFWTFGGVVVFGMR